MFKHVAVLNSKCLAIVLKPTEAKSLNSPVDSGSAVFQNFQNENRSAFWNAALLDCINGLDFVGFVRPGTLFVSGTETNLETLRSAWSRRILKSPVGFTIKSLGDIGGIEMQEVPQTQFIPLPEALCLVISSLNRFGQAPDIDLITDTLREQYPGISVPRKEVMYATLGALIASGKLHCNGDSYMVSTAAPYLPQSFQLPNFVPTHQSPMWFGQEDPMATSTKGKGIDTRYQETCSRECQTGASVVGGMAPYKPSAISKTQTTEVQTSSAADKKEVTRSKSLKSDQKPVVQSNKAGFFRRLFGRSKSKSRGGEKTNPIPNSQSKDDLAEKRKLQRSESQNSDPNSYGQPSIQVPLATFSAQFPPPEWLHDPKYLKFANQVAQRDVHPYVPGFFKAKKIKDSSECPSKGPSRAAQERNSVWIDFDPRWPVPPNSKAQRAVKYVDGMERDHPRRFQEPNVAQQPQLRTAGHQRERRSHRLSKYLSSSSECLFPLGAQNIDRRSNARHSLKPRFQRLEPHRPSRRNSLWSSGAPRDQVNLGSLQVSEPYRENGSDSALETGDERKLRIRGEHEFDEAHEDLFLQYSERTAKQHYRHSQYSKAELREMQRCRVAEFAHDDHFELKRTPLKGAKFTSTPTPSPKGTPQKSTNLVSPRRRDVANMRRSSTGEVKLPKQQQLANSPSHDRVDLMTRSEAVELKMKSNEQLRQSQEPPASLKNQLKPNWVANPIQIEPQQDSAYSNSSASPVITDMSSSTSSDKTNRYSSWPDSEGAVGNDKLNHTGKLAVPRDPMDHTYINLPQTKLASGGNLEETKFENVGGDSFSRDDLENSVPAAPKPSPASESESEQRRTARSKELEGDAKKSKLDVQIVKPLSSKQTSQYISAL